jgi:hypothetical protein
MPNDTSDTIARTAEASRRRTLVALGVAGLTTTLVSTFGTSAGKSAGKKARKSCKRQKASCTDQVTAICSQLNENSSSCLAAFLPCCGTCDVSVGVPCMLNILLTT